jgi:hypothetical protein
MKKIFIFTLFSIITLLTSCHSNHADDTGIYELTFKLTDNSGNLIAPTVNKATNFKLLIERKNGGIIHNLNVSIKTEDGKNIKEIINEHISKTSPYTLIFDHTFSTVGKYKVVANSTDANEAQPNNSENVFEVK